MLKISLSHRLQTLFDMVDNDIDNYYDLCCDHGKLGLSVFLHKRPRSKTVLNDQVESICSQLRDTIDTYIPNNKSIYVSCQKAQAISLIPQQKNFITIAGIGGPLMLQILDSLSLSSTDRLLLSPHTKIHEVRAYLHQNKYSLIEERLIYDDSHFYEILKVTPHNHGVPVSLIGEDIWKEANDINMGYLAKNIHYFEIQDHYNPSDFVKLYLSRYKALKFAN